LKSIFIYSFLLVFLLFSQLSAQEKKQIDYNAEIMEYDESINKDAMRLKGNVVFSHEGALMYCDSADFYSKQNSLEAYGSIHLNQGDSIDLYGDYLSYNGNTRFAMVRYNVKLTQDSAYLLTDSLNYDRNINMAHYFDYGKLVDSVNVLTSRQGFYYTDKRDFYAVDSVVLVNPDYTMHCDSLKYNVNSEIAYFFGPTEIISDTNYIYCENGWYNTKTDIAQFNQNAYLENNKQRLSGDSLYYERHKNGGHGFGEAFQNVELTDTVDKVTLRGHYAYYYENPERSMLVDSAYCIYVMEGDSLFFHADTIRSFHDTAGDYKIMKAYYQAKLYKSDFQGKCDSLIYTFQDSVAKLFYDPVLWSEDNQITADFIEIHTKNGRIDFALMNLNSMIVSQEDTIRFNQIKGNNMVGYFRNDSLYKIDVKGAGETIYYPKDDEGLVGANKATGSNMLIFMGDSEVDEIILKDSPEGTMNPVNHLPPSQLKLGGFQWLIEHRPLEWQDIFIWKEDSVEVKDPSIQKEK